LATLRSRRFRYWNRLTFHSEGNLVPLSQKPSRSTTTSRRQHNSLRNTILHARAKLMRLEASAPLPQHPAKSRSADIAAPP
jgi:hypothetical protein